MRTVSSDCCCCPAAGPQYSFTTLWKLRKSDGQIMWRRELEPLDRSTPNAPYDLTFGCGCWVDVVNDRIVQVGGDQDTGTDRLSVRLWTGLNNPQITWTREIAGVDGYDNCYCRIFGDYVWIVTNDGDAITLNVDDGTTSTQATISAPQFYYHNGRIWLEEGSADNTIQLGPFAEYDSTWSLTQSTSDTITSAYLSGSTYGVIYSDAGNPVLATIHKSDLTTTTDVEAIVNITTSVPGVDSLNSELVAYDGETFAIVTPAASAPLQSWGVDTSGSTLWRQAYRVGINESRDGLGNWGNNNGHTDGASQVANGSIVYRNAKFSLSTGTNQNGNSVTQAGSRIVTDGTYVFQAANVLRIYAWDITDGSQLWEFVHPYGGNFRDIWEAGDYVYVSGTCDFVTYF